MDSTVSDACHGCSYDPFPRYWDYLRQKPMMLWQIKIEIEYESQEPSP